MKKKSIKAPIILAILCAVGVYTVLFTDAGHRIQGAISESWVTVESDTSLIIKNEALSLMLKKDINNVTKITASLGYNDESLVLSAPESTSGTIRTENEDYSQQVIFNLDTPKNLSKGTILATWKITKVLPEIQTINLSEVQVVTSEGFQDLSTEGTGEF